MGTFQFICNLIILIAGVCAAITGILKFFGVPVNFFRNRHKEDKELQKTVTTAINKNTEMIEEIRNINLRQNSDIENIIVAVRDALRYKIMDIYKTYKQTKEIPISEKEKLDETMSDYKKLNGNSYIDKYYARMLTWTVVQDYKGEEI